MPEEMRPLGEDLANAGHTVLAVRLPGHGTDPRDLARVRRQDWLVAVEDGLGVLEPLADAIVFVGQSLGAVVVLTAAARYPVAGVVALSPPAEIPRPRLPVRPGLHAKGTPRDPELGRRREAEYPAYAAWHTRARLEMARLHAEMLAALPEIAVPALVVSSDGDPWSPASHGQRIVERIGSADKELVALTEPGHAISLDPARAEAVAAIERFIARL
jgi:carboxylesterase